MGEARARGPGPQDDLERLVETRAGLLRRNAEALELGVPVALADAEVEPAFGDEIERRGLLGQQHRVVPGQRHDRGPEPQPGRAHRQAGQQHERGRDLVPAGEMMLDQEARMQAERLRLDVEVEIVAKSLAGLRAEARVRRLAPYRADQNASLFSIGVKRMEIADPSARAGIGGREGGWRAPAYIPGVGTATCRVWRAWWLMAPPGYAKAGSLSRAFTIAGARGRVR